jgi:hypothetical protein
MSIPYRGREIKIGKKCVRNLVRVRVQGDIIEEMVESGFSNFEVSGMLEEKNTVRMSANRPAGHLYCPSCGNNQEFVEHRHWM